MTPIEGILLIFLGFGAIALYGWVKSKPKQKIKFSFPPRAYIRVLKKAKVQSTKIDEAIAWLIEREKAGCLQLHFYLNEEYQKTITKENVAEKLADVILEAKNTVGKPAGAWETTKDGVKK